MPSNTPRDLRKLTRRRPRVREFGYDEVWAITRAALAQGRTLVLRVRATAERWECFHMLADWCFEHGGVAHRWQQQSPVRGLDIKAPVPVTRRVATAFRPAPRQSARKRAISGRSANGYIVPLSLASPSSGTGLRCHIARSALLSCLALNSGTM